MASSAPGTGFVDNILTAMQSHAADAEVQMRACEALAAMAGPSADPQSREVASKLLGRGVMEAVAFFTLRSHPSDVSVLRAGCVVLRILAAAGGSTGGLSADGLEEFRDIAKNSRLQDTLCRALIAHSEHPGMCEPCAELLALLVEKAHDATAVAAAGGVVAVCEAAQASPRHHGMQRSAAQVLRRVYSHLPAVTRAVTPHEESLALQVSARVRYAQTPKPRQARSRARSRPQALSPVRRAARCCCGCCTKARSWRATSPPRCAPRCARRRFRAPPTCGARCSGWTCTRTRCC